MHALTLPAADHYDEMLLPSGAIRPHYQSFANWLHAQTPQALAKKHAEADLLFHKVGITFAVYGDEAGAERLIPFDTVPRIVHSNEWKMLEAGLRQRVTALNRFLWDIYHDHDIIKAGLIPAEQVFANAQYQPAMQGLDLPHGIYAHITGVDLIRHCDGGYYVLEDNLRVPSGVSYMLENRKMMMRLFPELFARYPVAPVAHYPTLLLDTLRHSSDAENPTVVVLTPGPCNSAYFEHAFLYMRTTVGAQRVDVIYRRIDDAFLDPLAFNADSMLGVPGLLSVYKQGHLILANAIGTGVADDKSIYPYVPDMVRFYLNEEPILHNVPTWQCRKPDDLAHVLEHMAELVVKEVHGAGGYGMLVGPASTAAEVADFKERVRANPSNYIAQPTLCLSSCPTFVESGIAPRHIDLRPFVLSGREVSMVAGGLTRVALKEGSLVVNSSQGGGTKDTWILEA